MESLKGRQASDGPPLALAGRVAVMIDIGTGDGRFVRHTAISRPEWCVIGVDACRENLRRAARLAPRNALFVIANALDLPAELHGLTDHVTINFPWGSLLSGLLDGHPGLLDGLCAVARPGASLEVRMNASALIEAGCTLELAGPQAARILRAAGFHVQPPVMLGQAALRAFPTTWSRRIGNGNDPRGVLVCGTRW